MHLVFSAEYLANKKAQELEHQTGIQVFKTLSADPARRGSPKGPLFKGASFKTHRLPTATRTCK